jgi:hypothetical protein
MASRNKMCDCVFTTLDSPVILDGQVSSRIAFIRAYIRVLKHKHATVCSKNVAAERLALARSRV